MERLDSRINLNLSIFFFSFINLVGSVAKGFLLYLSSSRPDDLTPLPPFIVVVGGLSSFKDFNLIVGPTIVSPPFCG